MGAWKHVSEEEMWFVRENMGKMSGPAMAKHMKRSEATTYKMMKQVRAEGGPVALRPAHAPAAVPGTAAQEPATRRLLEELFSGHELLYKKLLHLARVTFRRPESQVFYLVARAVRSFEREIGMSLEQADETRVEQNGAS